MNMEIQMTSSTYQIEVPRDQFVKITDEDARLENNHRWNEVLSEKLNGVSGVSDTDYSGHFGSYIFLTIDTRFDNELQWPQITKMIQENI